LSHRERTDFTLDVDILDIEAVADSSLNSSRWAMRLARRHHLPLDRAAANKMAPS
jgi:hypothetical protein